MWSDVGRLGALRNDSERLGLSERALLILTPYLHRACRTECTGRPEGAAKPAYRSVSPRDMSPARSLLHTPGVIAMIVPAPVMRPVDPR